jgi:hypothetical protein
MVAITSFIDDSASTSITTGSVTATSSVSAISSVSRTSTGLP